MKTKIKNEKEFKSVIDQLGKTLDDIDARKAEATFLKGMIEAYAKENRISRFKTDDYGLVMSKSSQALKRRSGVSEESVVALLKKSSTMGVFVTESYDTAGIKAHVKNLDNKSDILDALGLYLTEPERHAEVKHLGA